MSEKHLHVCVTLALSQVYFSQRLNKEIVESITQMRHLCVNARLTVSFRTVSDFFTDDGLTHRF